MTRALLILLFLCTSAHAQQNVRQSGNVTPGHAVMWSGTGIVRDAGTAAQGNLSSLGVTNAGGPGICVNSGPVTGAYNALCLSATTSGVGQIQYNAFLGATPGALQFSVNGVTINLPNVPGSTFATITGIPVVTGNLVSFANTGGTLQDAGFAITPSTTGLAYYTAGSNLAASGTMTQFGFVLGGGAGGSPTSTATPTAGQIAIGQTAAAPVPTTISGDATLNSAGALTITANAVTNAKSAQMNPVTIKGNPTASLANASDFTINGLTARGAPDASNDRMLLWDAAAGTLKYVTPGQVAAAATAGVSLLGGATGAITLSAGLSIPGNVLTNTGVLSLGAATGALTLESGLAIKSSTILNAQSLRFVRTNLGI